MPRHTSIKWTWPRYFFTNLVMMPFSAIAGAIAGYVLFQLVVTVYMLAGFLVGADLDFKNNRTAHDWFLYLGAAVGVVIQWIWLWADEMSTRSSSSETESDA